MNKSYCCYVILNRKFEAFSECSKCTKCDHLILRKIINIAATRRHILRIKCTKFDFGWGSAPDPAGGAHSAPPDPLFGLHPGPGVYPGPGYYPGIYGMSNHVSPSPSDSQCAVRCTIMNRCQLMPVMSSQPADIDPYPG